MTLSRAFLTLTLTGCAFVLGQGVGLAFRDESSCRSTAKFCPGASDPSCDAGQCNAPACQNGDTHYAGNTYRHCTCKIVIPADGPQGWGCTVVERVGTPSATGCNDGFDCGGGSFTCSPGAPDDHGCKTCGC